MNLAHLLTEQVNPNSKDIDRLKTIDVLRIINEEDQKVASAVAAALTEIAQAVDQTVDRVRQGGRIFYIGAGTSGRLGLLDAAECPPTFHVPEERVQGILAGGESAFAHATEASEDDERAGRRDLAARKFSGGDVLIGISASGRTPYVLGAVAAARELGALTIGISCTPDSELAHRTNIAITPLVGPEVIAGSTRMKAGTATKLVLNMISTAVMIRLGYVYKNLMVNVQAKNKKLEDRARRIVVEAAEVGYDRAGELLREAGGDARTAIIMSRLHLDRAAAERKLTSAHGRIAEALES